MSIEFTSYKKGSVRIKMGNLSNAKILGGVGALLTLLTVIPTVGGILGIIGFILVLIAVKYIADETKEKSIFDNFLYFFITVVVAIVVAIIILALTIQSVGGFSYIMEIQNLAYSDPMAIWEYVQPVVFGVIAALVALWALFLISTIFLKKSYDKIGELTKVKWFNTTALLFLLGAATTIILIGILIIVIAVILQIVAFFSLPDNLTKAA